MLRIHFTDADLARTKVASGPDPLWEVCASLHRLQTRRGRWAYADWYRTSRDRLRATHLARTVREVLLPLVPRAAYFPDFLTPPESSAGLESGLEAILATPPSRVLDEVGILGRTSGAPAWAPRLAERGWRTDLVKAMRAYHDVVIAPHGDRVQARVEAARSERSRLVLNHGAEGVLRDLGPCLRWRPPVLHTVYPEDRDLHLRGRGLRLVPSYFSWGNPVAFAESSLDPVLFYSLTHEPRGDELPGDLGSAAPLGALLGRTRASVLRATATGATTGELARSAGVSPSTASQHATALRDNGLIVTNRHASSVLHTLTPLGAALLRGGLRRSG
ncbi:ArsR/SmtB family transcription factor [Streptomyces sp. bgisy091]|uniref:ArsR/SmtB family transcription factor n=1 Tax=Streptomyces sp. bgisy091 TaxID=3413778 RepID=UPI003D72C6B7